MAVTHSASAQRHRLRAAQPRGRQPNLAAVDFSENGSTVASRPVPDVFPVPAGAHFAAIAVGRGLRRGSNCRGRCGLQHIGGMQRFCVNLTSAALRRALRRRTGLGDLTCLVGRHAGLWCRESMTATSTQTHNGVLSLSRAIDAALGAARTAIVCANEQFSFDIR